MAEESAVRGGSVGRKRMSRDESLWAALRLVSEISYSNLPPDLGRVLRRTYKEEYAAKLEAALRRGVGIVVATDRVPDYYEALVDTIRLVAREALQARQTPPRKHQSRSR